MAELVRIRKRHRRDLSRRAGKPVRLNGWTELKRLPFGVDVVAVDAHNLPTQDGPVPDRMTIWPMDDGRYGLDATFQGSTGYERAERHARTLEEGGVAHSFRQELGDAWTLRFGPLSAADVSTALRAFVQ